MPPSCTLKDMANGSSGDLKKATQLRRAMCAFRVQTTYFLDLAFGENSLRMNFALRTIKSLFFLTILDIIVGRPQKQVRGIDAQGGITSVTNAEAWRDRTLQINPEPAVSLYSLALSPEVPISFAINSCPPHPAGISLIDFSPKAFDHSPILTQLARRVNGGF